MPPGSAPCSRGRSSARAGWLASPCRRCGPGPAVKAPEVADPGHGRAQAGLFLIARFDADAKQSRVAGLGTRRRPWGSFPSSLGSNAQALHGCSMSTVRYQPPRRGRRRPPGWAMYSWFNPPRRCRRSRLVRVRRLLQAPVVCLGFSRQDVADGFEQAMVVEPRDPNQRCQFDRLARPPRPAPVDDAAMPSRLRSRGTQCAAR